MKRILFLLGIIGFLAACQSHEYYNKLDKELASGQRYDSLFLDISFGMTKKEFYTHCWELNKQGIIMHGGKNMTVKYDLPHQLKSKAKMNFYPDFYEDKIYKMPVIFSYEGWAPWNEELNADALLIDILSLYRKWYNDDFIKVESSENERKAYIMIKGNRRISIYKKSKSEVEVLYTDVLAEKDIKKKRS